MNIKLKLLISLMPELKCNRVKMVGTCLIVLMLCAPAYSQSRSADLASQVNVFLGTSGDHGQLSPAACYPFSMLSIVPQTYPSIHTGYEYYAKKFLGFAHSCFEGVGCQGSGANLLVKPFVGTDPGRCDLIKKAQTATPGYYGVQFENGMEAAFTVGKREGIHQYTFPKQGTPGSTEPHQKGLYFDLSHSRANGFVGEKHQTNPQGISGWIESGTTCSVGKYKIYYHIKFSQPVKWKQASAHKLVAMLPENAKKVELRIGWSSTNQSYAAAALDQVSFQDMKKATHDAWNKALSHLLVTPPPANQMRKGDRDLLAARAGLFYSLLYRVIQSPYAYSEADGHFRGSDGKLTQSGRTAYSGWSVWDNYRTQLPLLSLAYGKRYKDIVWSLGNLYVHGKQDYATQYEPTNTVRTEHSVVVLLDGYRKGYPVDFNLIIDSLKKEVDALDFSHPDKALESSYDTWALSEIYGILHQTKLQQQYKEKAAGYKKYWKAEFSDLTKKDVDRMQARGMYQGTVWQYRWLVPYDIKGLMELAGGRQAFEGQLDQFFGGDYYNQANEPDIEAPALYNVTASPWKSQELMKRYAVDTVVQYYFNNNSRGIDPVVGPVYQNKPRAYLRTMDDDGGAMSAWFVFAACGLFPACVGQPVYYLHVPLFPDIKMKTEKGGQLHITVRNFGKSHPYIKEIRLDGKLLSQLYLTQDQINNGHELEITASSQPVKRAKQVKQWISSL